MNLVNEIYRAVEESREDRIYEHWHASSIAECPRAHYFKRLGIPPLETPGAGKMLRWDGGHALEEGLRPKLLKIWPDLETNERATDKKLDLTGEWDGWIPSERTIVEIKSVHLHAFKADKDKTWWLKEHDGFLPNGKNKWKIKKDPYLHHEYQTHSYKLLKPEAEKVIYIYVALDGRLCTYETPIKKDITDNVLKRLDILNEAWEKRQPPICLCEEGHPLYDGVMQFCDYRSESECCSLQLIKEK